MINLLIENNKFKVLYSTKDKNIYEIEIAYAKNDRYRWDTLENQRFSMSQNHDNDWYIELADHTSGRSKYTQTEISSDILEIFFQYNFRI